MRKRYPSKFKAKVAVEAMKEDQTMADLSAKFGVHRVQIQRWKNEALAQLLGLFSGKKITGDCSLKKPKNGLDMGSTSNSANK